METELATANEEATRIRREAEAYADATRRRVDAVAEARIRRLRELSDRLIATAETVDRHFAEAVEVKAQLDDLILALGVAADTVARQVLDGEEGFEPVLVEPPRDAGSPLPSEPGRAEPLTPARLVQVLDVAQSASRFSAS